jgi:YVTN family beta-propeller protein
VKKYKIIFILLTIILSLIPAFLNAQWLETTIFLDSIYGISNPCSFTYNATNNSIYVGGEQGNCVIAIDGQTNQKIAKIPAGSGIRALCWNSANNKVYCANYGSNNVTVINGASDSVITIISVGGGPRV